ncbi:MAG: sulfite exporter TauE/SafE family protein [Bacillota bacterium]|nr:sulfite exporter TauE/SafE family protein [Bacillota bacterium]
MFKISILYFLITLFATTLGSTSGMGGGVIIKPVLDAFGHYDIETISVLSSVSVFLMCLISVSKKIRAGNDIKLDVAVPLSVGAVGGGYCGNYIFETALANQNANIVKIIQNSLLGLMLAVIFIYMLNKDKIKSLNLKSKFWPISIGFSLGMISSFLGIGGGPVNVAAFVFLFGYSAKTASSASLITILFSQISKLLSVLLGTGFGAYDLTILPYMLIGAATGGFLGSQISRRLSEKNVVLFFNITQILIFLICMFNIYNTILYL